MSKMTIGVVGLGKLGLPIAVAIGSRGYKVLGYDINENLMKKRKYEHREMGPYGQDDFQDFFDAVDLTFHPLPDVLKGSDIVFIIVQTPHGPEYEGSTRLPHTRTDFDYTYLREACIKISELRKPDQVIVVSSTVLPGTIRRDIIPWIPDVCYNPAFPAMGTCLEDYLFPEFVLLSGDSPQRLEVLRKFYEEMLSDFGMTQVGRKFYSATPFKVPPIKTVSIESAELTKVSYNTFITAKITIANNIMEIAHKTPGCDCDEVSGILALANKRVCSPSYIRGAMGDGGPCHGRDCIAMSWLAGSLNLSTDIFDNIMHSREWQTEWLVHLFLTHGKDMKKVILGKSYKPQSSITTGSSALLFANLLKEKEEDFAHIDPYVDDLPVNAVQWASNLYLCPHPAAFFIATKHEIFKQCRFPKGSVVIDPFRFIMPQDGVRLVPVGVGR